MRYTYNINDKLVPPKLILANPQKNKIGLVSDVEDLEIKPFFASISEMSFKILMN
jgi:hypothetical protein